jgi:uncharacterized repeat protein (TIGR03803 family)
MGDKRRKDLKTSGLALIVMLALGAAQTMKAQNYTEEILYSFTGGSQSPFYPYSGLVMDSAGNLYGTTSGGGADQWGTVFQLSPNSWPENTLHSFTSFPDGAAPYARLLLDTQGNLWGTTADGGDRNCNCGTVFKLDAAGYETVVHTFLGGADGASPFAGLIMDSAGNLYGTTVSGGGKGCSGKRGCGTVFKIDTNGNESVLYKFASGGHLQGDLVRDSAGNLYGTTYYGGAGKGTVFMLSQRNKMTVLHKFTGSPDGMYPFTGLLRSSSGVLYGTTPYGGLAGSCTNQKPTGCGTIFQINKAGTETVLYRFTGGSDGASPEGDLISDQNGNLYGVTFGGGNLNCNPPYGCGVVFRLDTLGNETTLHTFQAGDDGWGLYAGLIMDSVGDLYGTTAYGGGGSCAAPGCGTVFELIP